jgi:hypothetical protein
MVAMAWLAMQLGWMMFRDVVVWLFAVFAEFAKPEQYDLVIVSGVGSVWPLLRSHTLLNNLQPVMGKTPLVMFYPGRYDGQSLRLFGKIKSNNYYRAFKLVSCQLLMLSGGLSVVSCSWLLGAT